MTDKQWNSRLQSIVAEQGVTASRAAKILVSLLTPTELVELEAGSSEREELEEAQRMEEWQRERDREPLFLLA